MGLNHYYLSYGVDIIFLLAAATKICLICNFNQIYVWKLTDNYNLISSMAVFHKIILIALVLLALLGSVVAQKGKGKAV